MQHRGIVHPFIHPSIFLSSWFCVYIFFCSLLAIAAVLSVASNSLLGHAHLSSISGVRLPLGRSAGGRLGKHLVDLLEGEALGLGHKQVSVDEAAGAEATPDVKHLGAQIALVLVDHVGSDDGDDAVP